MRIIELKIKNFRNLNNIEIHFHPKMTFLVGENNLGKSNLLDFLDIIFNKRRFDEDDFCDKERSIEAEISLELDDIEKGIFEDFFDPTQDNLINIKIKQESSDDDIRYFHKESEQEIHYLDIRCANFIKYDSLRSPKEELTFYRGRGVGKFLNYLVRKYFENQERQGFEVFIKRDSIELIIDYINRQLIKLEIFKKFGISASIEEETESLIYRILTIKDVKGLEIKKVGYGIQFLLLIVLSILERMMNLFEDPRRRRCIYSEENGNKYISLILGLDEPEIHLHPYMQRNLIKYIDTLLSNKDDEFLDLLKELFNIDGVLGQAIISTHSPSILLDDYKQIVRLFCSQNYLVKTKSGIDINFDSIIEKHLFMNLPYIKEAFFSRCVIIVEGETELGALSVWGNKISGNLDKYGISIIKAGGKGSAVPIAELLGQFNIYSVPVIDRDNNVSRSFSPLIITNKIDFEEEIVDKLMSENRDLLFEIVKNFDDRSLDRRIQQNKLKQIANKYNIEITWSEKDYKFSEIKDINDFNLIKTMFLSWFNINKSIVLGRFIGEKIDNEYIPEPYCNAIIMGMELSENG